MALQTPQSWAVVIFAQSQNRILVIASSHRPRITRRSTTGTSPRKGFSPAVSSIQLLSVPARRAAFREQVTTSPSRLRTRTDRSSDDIARCTASGRDEEPVRKLVDEGR